MKVKHTLVLAFLLCPAWSELLTNPNLPPGYPSPVLFPPRKLWLITPHPLGYFSYHGAREKPTSAPFKSCLTPEGLPLPAALLQVAMTNSRKNLSLADTEEDQIQVNHTDPSINNSTPAEGHDEGFCPHRTSPRATLAS